MFTLYQVAFTVLVLQRQVVNYDLMSPGFFPQHRNIFCLHSRQCSKRFHNKYCFLKPGKKCRLLESTFPPFSIIWEGGYLPINRYFCYCLLSLVYFNKCHFNNKYISYLSQTSVMIMMPHYVCVFGESDAS